MKDMFSEKIAPISEYFLHLNFKFIRDPRVGIFHSTMDIEAQ